MGKRLGRSQKRSLPLILEQTIAYLIDIIMSRENHINFARIDIILPVLLSVFSSLPIN